MSDQPEHDAPGRPRYWRSVVEQAGGFEVAAENDEFPDRELPSESSRREFFKFAGASLTLAGLTGCLDLKQPEETIVPYVEPPEQLVPGRPLYFSTSFERAGRGLGLIAESHEGRPTKIEGNPDHPSSGGATDIFAQAELLGLYDPDRSRTVIDRTTPGGVSSLSAFRDAIAGYARQARQRQGAGLHVLSGAVASPTLGRLLHQLSEELPQSAWHVWEPTATFAEEFGSQLAFKKAVRPVYRFDRTTTILVIDADVLGSSDFPPCYARQIMDGRRLTDRDRVFSSMSQLFAIECTPTLTGAKADHRLTVPADAAIAAAFGLARRLGVKITPPTSLAPEPSPKWLDRVARHLAAAGGDQQAVVVAGPHQPPVVHAITQLLNFQLNAVGHAVVYVEPPLTVPPDLLNEPDQTQGLRKLAAAMRSGTVETLLIVGGDPVYTAPAEFELARLLSRVPYSIHLGAYDDATSENCRWHVPQSHFLESWGDTRGHDGTASIIQPLIRPLFDSLTAIEVVGAILGDSQTGHELVRQTWSERLRGDFDRKWHDLLRAGVVPQSSSPPLDVSVTDRLDEQLQTAAAAAMRAAPVFLPADGQRSASQQNEVGSRTFDVIFRPDPTIGDGCYANNAWLQELPKPLHKLTWGTAALISPHDAAEMHLSDGSIIAIRHGHSTVELPVLQVPGHPQGSLTLSLGHGRRTGQVAAAAVGPDVGPLRNAQALWWAREVTVRPTGQLVPLATTQTHFRMEGADLVRNGTLQELQVAVRQPSSDAPSFVHPHGHASDKSLYPPWKYDGHAWAMSIDLTACTGCSACVIACQAENNIPVVGREEVLRHREMHWIRIDTYYEGSVDHPRRTLQQPVPCMHCENAPCEPVCPVAATVHSGTGLNQMVYNRCIGTRYCSNNCPYKVRRFNFLAYAETFHRDPLLELLPNPDVTVRSRGVMEKCTYCVQRIQKAVIETKRHRQSLTDGEIVTACQQVCPTQAIVFGDKNDPNSEVARLKKSYLNYGLLENLNTQPRTTYLAGVFNADEHMPGPAEATA